LSKFPKHRKRLRGFTLMELLVVIALIALLATVMVPVMVNFMKGRGLGMIGNSLAGFVAAVRTDAMNTRDTHVMVFYEERVDITPEGSMLRLQVGPGVAAWRVNSHYEPGADRLTYVRHIDFTQQFGGDITYPRTWSRQAPRGPIIGLPDYVNTRFEDHYKIAVRPDGRMVILDDKPGYVLDMNVTRGLDTDLVLTDGTRFLFVDFNALTGNVKRSHVIHQSETDYGQE
jgi:prepilin-type N-terminal cleavage/methylation domain-containing protein